MNTYFAKCIFFHGIDHHNKRQNVWEVYFESIGINDKKFASHPHQYASGARKENVVIALID